eukprot:TRINITY_DN4952_c0_g1_i1.p1 TRINITY_DN4952_c0_g1~~TRINITY_DN4952_c0_g1_i1.p1  ORF type:complete len:1123 (+),score=226.28 TRINITY_DN4952_c0_g1_i1:470-3370(+)
MYQTWKQKTEATCIPRQLQKLFLRLNTSDKRACETKNLTKSFGWKQDDAFTQHDVQELCRVLFDALDTVWKGTEQANMINELYQGEMKDYVQCLSCGHESSRTDKYLDIPLVIKGFGEAKAVGSIEEALRKFVEPETLSGDNQYYCDKCNKKTDARKGLKFTSFPYLLSLQLKRFDFDFQSLRRIKLNDRVTFPEILDLNPYLTRTAAHARNVDPETENGTDDLNSKEDDDTEVISTSPLERAKKKRQQDIEMALRNGPLVYELFSVLIHRGSALGGHYYAYTKSFGSGKWFEFNDSIVKEISPDAFKETFGENEKRSNMTFFSSGMNAYMLMYRQYNPVRNEVEPSKDNIPESVKILIEEENRLEEEKEQEKERQRSMSTIKIYYKEHIFESQFERTTKMQTVKEEAAKHFKIEHLLPNNLRLRDFQSYNLIPKDPITDEQLEKTIEEVTYPYSAYQAKCFWVETKKEDAVFIKYDRMDTILKVVFYDVSTNSWSPIEFYWFNPRLKLFDIKSLFASERYNNKHRPEELVIVKEEYIGRAKILENNELDLNRSDLFDGHKIFVEPRMEDGKEPRSIDEIDRVKNAIEISYSNADEKEFKHKLTVDKRITLLALKQIIEKEINLSIDEFKIYRVVGENYKTELRNEDEKLFDCFLYNNSKLSVERGKPLRQGEVICKCILYDLEKDKRDFLFEIPLPGKLTIFEVKTEIVKHWNQTQSNEATKRKDDLTIPNDPSRLRIRNVYDTRISTIHADSKLLKDVSGKFYGYNTDLYIQVLPEGRTETKRSDDTVIIILRQFHPESYDLGPCWEFDANKDEKLGDFRDRIAKEANINPSTLSFAMADMGDLNHILRIPDLNWHPKLEEEPQQEKKSRYYHYYQDIYDPDRFVRSLNLFEGDILLYRDTSIPLKQLSEQEITKIKEVESKARQAKMKASTTYYHRKEERLDIKVAEVSIGDEETTNDKKKKM